MQILHESRLTCTNLLACNFFSFLFCFLFLWGFLFALIARAVRVFIYTIREIYLAPKTFHKFAQLPPKSTARRSLKWPNEQRGRAAAAELSISQNVARLPISFSSSPSPSHSHSSFPSFSFSPFSPTPTQPKSLPYCTKSLHCFADAQCACLRVERKWNVCVECKQRTKATSCSANCLTTQVKSAPWACKCAVGAFVCT